MAAWATRLRVRATRTARYSGVRITVVLARRWMDEPFSTHAAAISFQTTLSVFPLVAGTLAVASFAVDVDRLTDRILELASFLAPGSREVLHATVESVTNARAPIGVVALAGLLWSASSLFLALHSGLDLALRCQRRRSAWGGRLVALGLVVVTGFLLAASVAVTAVLAYVARTPALGPAATSPSLHAAWQVAGYLVPVLFTGAVFALLYRYLPSAPPPWITCVQAGAVSAFGFELGKHAFLWASATFGGFNAVYGPLAAVVVLLVWQFVSSGIFLLGGALAAELAAPGDRAARA